MAGITVIETLEADVPTPAATKDTIFVDPTNGLGYKDDAGTAHYATIGGITSLTGDVTATGPGAAAATIANDAITTVKILNANVTLAKIANAAANDKLLGSGNAGSGAPYAEIALGSGLTMTGTTLSASGSGGTVTTTGSPANGNLTKFSGASSITNGDLSGDVTTAGALTTTIANSVVTLAKIQNAAANSKLVGSGSAGSGSAYSEITLGSGLSMSSTTLNLSTAVTTSAIGIIINGNGSAITTGVAADLYVPFTCTITAVTMLADQSGSIVVDIWKDILANYPPTIADTITASAKPTISAATNSQDTTLTGWTTTITAGDTLRFNVDSASTVTRVVLTLTVTR